MGNDDASYILYGMPHSLYTGKARCYLRNRNIAYFERSTTHPDFAKRVVPRIGRRIVPVLETPSGEFVQDTIDIIDYFERRGVAYPAYPERPLQRVVAILIEYFGCQAMRKHAMHYRWSYRTEQEAFLREAFVGGVGPATTDQIMARMDSYLPMLGVTEATIPLIEHSFGVLLDTLNAHFAVMPYLLGGRPSIADYGLIAPLFAHLGRDPVPAAIMKTRAPRVFRWVERMTAPGLDVVEYPNATPEFASDDRIPESLHPFLAYLAEDIQPELGDKLAFFDRWVAEHRPVEGAPVTDKPHRRQLGTIETRFRGVPIAVGVEPYLLYLLQRAVDTLEAADGATSQRVLDALRRFGLDDALPTGRAYRVARKDHIEVWRFT